MSTNSTFKMPDWPMRKAGEYFLLFHSVRCVFHLAHPISVMQARDMLWSALLRCNDNHCFITVGKMVISQDSTRVLCQEVHEQYRRSTGHLPGYISRKDRQGITDPKTMRELVTWMAQTRKRKKP